MALKDYEPVEVRLARFWADHTAGRVATDLVHGDGQRYVFRAEIYTDREDTRPAATGYAEETVTTKGVNSTNAIENCETSAIGRALANLNYAPKGARPSREEMEKAQRQQHDPLTALKSEVSALGAQLGRDIDGLMVDYADRYGGQDLKAATQAKLVDYRDALKAEVQAKNIESMKAQLGATEVTT